MLYLYYILLIIPLAAAVAGAVWLCRRAVRTGVLSPAAGKPAPAWEVLRAAAAAFGLFFLAESGIERYIGFSLFAPVRDGQPMAVRAWVFFLCAALSFGTAMTAKGRALCRKFTAACGKDRVRWLTALAVTGLFFLWALRVTVLSYMTNDEASLICTFAGVAENGLSAAGGAFSNVLFCGLLSLFYKLNPEGLWYFGYHLFALLGSAVIIGRCVLTKAGRRGLSALTGCLIHFLLCAGIFLYALAQLSFTVTPAVVGSAAVALVLCRDEPRTRLGRAASDTGCVILMLLCWLHRQAVGQCLLCFWALAMAYAALRLVLSRAERWKRQLLALVLSALSLSLLCFGTSSFSDSAQSGASGDDGGYWTAEYYRSMVMDYMAEDLTDEQWESVGIPRELGLLVKQWYFMDERVNTDTFRALTEKYYAGQAEEAAELSVPERLAAAAGELWTAVTGSPTMLWLTILILCLLALCAAGACLGGWRRCRPALLCALCAAGGFFLLCLYLVYDGRFLVRVFLTAAIPAIVTLLLLFLSLPPARPRTEGRGNAAAIAALAVFGLAAGWCCAESAYFTPHAAAPDTRADVFAGQWALNDYLTAHPDIYFVTNYSARGHDPLEAVQSAPSNIGLWGGTGVTAQTEGRLYADAFFRDDVQFLYISGSTVIPVLQYLTLDNGPVRAELLAQLSPELFVCDFTRITPGEDYTGWYEQNGLTYYFENGEAVTGAKTIDGVKYEFAPAGAEAKLTASIDGETGHTVYATNAYSLVSGG